MLTVAIIVSFFLIFYSIPTDRLWLFSISIPMFFYLLIIKVFRIIKKPKPAPTLVKQFNVAGLSYRKDNVSKAMREIIEENGRSFYEGYTNKEIKQYGPVNKYSGFRTSQVILEKELSNAHDNNAVQVLVHGIHVGYVPKDLSMEIKEFLEQNEKEILYILEIVDGPFKDYDYYESKIINVKDNPINFDLLIYTK